MGCDLAMQAQLLDTYDAAGRPLGPRPRDEVHRDGLWHRSFHCWIAGSDRHGHTAIVLQRRGPYKSDYPDRLDMAAAGHLLAGEGIDGGLREIREELGVDVVASELRPLATRQIDEVLYNGAINREFQEIYLLTRPPDSLMTYRPTYPEVAAVLTTGLRDVLDLLCGKVATVRAACRTVGPDGEAGLPRAVRLRGSDFILEARSYVSCVLTLIDAVVSGAAPDPALLARRQLDDGSNWTPQSG